MSVHYRAVESFHSALRRRVKVAHPNLYTFLGLLQLATADSETEIARLNRDMSIQRCKKRTNLVNDARIKSCIARYDSGAYTRVQFLRAVSHSVGAHAVPAAATDASDTDDDQDVSCSLVEFSYNNDNVFETLFHTFAFHTNFFSIFHPCKLVPHFHVLQFPPVQSGAANSCLAFQVLHF